MVALRTSPRGIFGRDEWSTVAARNPTGRTLGSSGLGHRYDETSRQGGLASWLAHLDQLWLGKRALEQVLAEPCG